jgi:hypothetical protein
MKWQSLFKRKIDQKLAFIFGCPRGGTTYLWSLLESNEMTVPFINGVIKDENGFYSTSESGIYIKKPEAAKQLIGEFLKQNKNKLVFEKTPLHTLKYKEIIKDFPNSKYIVIYRHPLAIVSSIINSSMNAFKDETLADCISTVQLYYAHLKEIEQLDNSKVVIYENMLRDCNNELFKLFNYLEISVDKVKDIVLLNYKTSKVSVSGVLRKGEASSYKEELSKENQNNLIDLLSKQINHYEGICKSL